METITQQDRITLNNLKVADFASEETLCFTAIVEFDGIPATTDMADRHSCVRYKARSRFWPRRRNSPGAFRRPRSTSNERTKSR